MKKVISLLLALSMLFVLCGCGNAPSEDSNKISASGLEQELLDALKNDAAGMLLYKMNSFAEARKSVSPGWETGVKFTSYEFTSVERVDDFTIRAYGKVYGKTVYSDPVSCTFEVNAWFETSDGGNTLKTQYGLGRELK